MTMKTSTAGLARLEQREGRELVAYQDTKGVWTIGIGCTTWQGLPVHQDQKITSAECDAEFAAQLVGYEAAVNTAVKVPLSQNQFDACVSLAWNIGKGGFAGSTVVKRLNAGDYQGASEAFLMWEKPASLKNRREGEVAQFLTPDVVSGTKPPIARVPPVVPPKKPAKTAAGATVVIAAGGAIAAGQTLPHGHWAVWALGSIAVIAAAVFAAIHWRK